MAKKEEKKSKGTEKICEGGPTFNEIENWKQEFGDVYRIDFEEEVYIFRTINRMEYKQLMNSIEAGQESNASWFREEQLCDMAVLWPKDYGRDKMTEGKAGIPTVVSEYIMSKSGFNSNGGPQRL